MNMKQRIAVATLGLIAFLANGENSKAQRAPRKEGAQEPNAYEKTAQRIVGYRAHTEPDFHTILPSFPEVNSLEDQNDVAALWHWQEPERSARWELANADVRMSYDQFAEAFGASIDHSKTPLLVHLLNRVEQDVQSVAFSAKSYYARPRPYQRFQMDHICGAEKAPAPEVPLNGGSSYPSGHTSFGWAAVLILAEVAPENASQLLARGREYGESRIVCAVHYPSDVVAGELVAIAVVMSLHTVPEFQQDLECAREEYKASIKNGDEISHACQLHRTRDEK